MSIFDNDLHHAPSESCRCDPNHTVYMSPEGFAEHIAALAWGEGFNDGAHYASADLSHATYSAPPPPNPYQVTEGDQE